MLHSDSDQDIPIMTVSTFAALYVICLWRYREHGGASSPVTLTGSEAGSGKLLDLGVAHAERGFAYVPLLVVVVVTVNNS